jgi:hypothetical protein
MKEILLGVTGIGAEMRFRKTKQLGRLGAPLWKIKPAQCFHHPNVHRESTLEPAGKEQNTIGNLGADARKLQQFTARLLQRPQPETVQIDFRESLGGREEIRGPKAHFARPGKAARRSVGFG